MKTIKCVVWDLDNTIWNGILLEDHEVTLRNHIVRVMRTLDERGILQSVASKNHEGDALGQLEAFSLKDYFLYPQINWNSKSDSIRRIAETINIGLDSVAFIDDSAVERDEVSFSLPQVMCIDSAKAACIPNMRAFKPRFITDDSRLRRKMYQTGLIRNQKEKEFTGPKEDFLATLGMKLTIFPAEESDLKRAEELTVRTNQLNATGYTYSYDDLNRFRLSKTHMLLMAKLTDIYGEYGHIGLALIECAEEEWTIKLLLMSCRVMNRGIGTALLNRILSKAKKARVRLKAEFVENERNRMMNVTYRLAGFRDGKRMGDVEILEHDMVSVPSLPGYIDLVERQEKTN
jgi:FkbH-like protein